MKQVYKSSNYVDRVCATCSSPFLALRWEIARGKGRFCSPRCAHVASGRISVGRAQTGILNRNWRGGVSLDKERYRERHIKKYPERHRARRLLENAVHNGKIVKPARCGQCGIPCNPDGHHPDYSKPLEVEWLCGKCHKGRHPNPRGGRLLAVG